MRPRYVLHPGHVISKEDGQRHYVDARALMFLYKVHADDCVDPSNLPPFRHSDTSFKVDDSIIHLYPQSSGDYRLP